MATFRTLSAALVLSLVAVSGAVAQSDDMDERLRVAREHVRLFVVEQMIHDMVPAMAGQIASDISASKPDLPQDEVRLVADRIAELAAERMGRDLPDVTAQIMANHFTTSEITALTEFYSTPDGRSIVGKMAAYSTEIMQQVIPYIREMAPEVAQNAISQLKEEGAIE